MNYKLRFKVLIKVLSIVDRSLPSSARTKKGSLQPWTQN